MTTSTNKPGCYGLAIIHSACSLCKTCSVRDGCRKEAKETLDSLSYEMEVGDLMRHYTDLDPVIEIDDQPKVVSRRTKSDTTKLELATHQIETIERLPVKAAAIAKSLFADGVQVGEYLHRGVNPIRSSDKWQYVRIACHLLLNGGFTKKQLKDEFRQKDPQLKERTAEGNVSTVFALLNGLNVIKQGPAGFYTLR